MDNHIIDLFAQMVLEVDRNGNKLFRRQGVVSLAASYTTIGKSYAQNKVKFMAVGDAINVADDFRWSLGQFEKENNIKSFSERVINVYRKRDLEYITQGKTVNGQSYMSHLYWKYLCKIFEKLNRNAPDQKDWAQNIATSNLYKISPADGKNPNITLAKIQLDCCKEILKWDIEALRPQYITFISCKKRGGGKVFDAFKDEIEKLQEKMGFYYVVLDRPELKGTEKYLEYANSILQDKFGITIEK